MTRRSSSASTKYILCRPQGGLNDCLCQIEYCRKLSKRNFRSLIIQTEIGNKYQLNRFHEPFYDLFQFTNHSASLSAEILSLRGNSKLSVNPDALFPITHNLNISLSEATNGKVQTYRLPKYKKLTCDIEIHETWGGGLASANLFRHIKLSDSMSILWNEAVHKFPTNFIGVHFRNTDHKSSVELLIQEIRKIKMDEVIIIFSDDEKIINLLKEKFPEKNILKSSDLLCDLFPLLTTTRLAIIELLIMSKAKYLILVPLENLSASPKFSGYSRLAKHLWFVNKVKSKEYAHLIFSPQPIKGLAGFKNSLLNALYLPFYEIPRILFQSKYSTGIYGLI